MPNYNSKVSTFQINSKQLTKSFSNFEFKTLELQEKDTKKRYCIKRYENSTTYYNSYYYYLKMSWSFKILRAYRFIYFIGTLGK